MKIELEEPYKSDWKYRYLYEATLTRRAHIVLYRNKKDMSLVSLARYKLAVLAGRYLTDEEQADHVDRNWADDSEENIQILTIEEHREKTNQENTALGIADIYCASCGKPFQRIKSQIRANRGKSYCGVPCMRQGQKSKKSS